MEDDHQTKLELIDFPVNYWKDIVRHFGSNYNDKKTEIFWKLVKIKTLKYSPFTLL